MVWTCARDTGEFGSNRIGSVGVLLDEHLRMCQQSLRRIHHAITHLAVPLPQCVAGDS